MGVSAVRRTLDRLPVDRRTLDRLSTDDRLLDRFCVQTKFHLGRLKSVSFIKNKIQQSRPKLSNTKAPKPQTMLSVIEIQDVHVTDIPVIEAVAIANRFHKLLKERRFREIFSLMEPYDLESFAQVIGIEKDPKEVQDIVSMIEVVRVEKLKRQGVEAQHSLTRCNDMFDCILEETRRLRNKRSREQSYADFETVISKISNPLEIESKRSRSDDEDTITSEDESAQSISDEELDQVLVEMGVPQELLDIRVE